MSLAWVALVSAVCLIGASCLPNIEEKCLVAFAEHVVQEADRDLAFLNLGALPLPNIGVLPWDPIKLRNGLLGNLSSAALKGRPKVGQTNGEDGSSDFRFHAVLTLEEAFVGYDFRASVLGLYEKSGKVNLAARNNSMSVSGTLILNDDKACSASLADARLLEFGDFEVRISPQNFPLVADVSKSILSYISPKLQPLVNKVIGDLIGTHLFRSGFSALICRMFIH